MKDLVELGCRAGRGKDVASVCEALVAPKVVKVTMGAIE